MDEEVVASAHRLWRERYSLDPLPDDIDAMRAAFRGEPTFADMAPDDKVAFCRGVHKALRLGELADEVARLHTASQRSDEARVRFEQSLAGLIGFIEEKDNLHLIRVRRALTDRLGLSLLDVDKGLAHISALAGLLRDISQSLPPPAPNPSRPTRKQVERRIVLETLESLDVEVGVSVDGPGSRLVRLALRYIGKDPGGVALKKWLDRHR